MARSLLFNLVFYVTTTLFVVLGSPLAVRPEALGHGGARLPCAHRAVAAQTYRRPRITSCAGRDKLPNGACLVASKHQSAWETFALIPFFRDPALLMKRELFWIPVPWLVLD